MTYNTLAHSQQTSSDLGTYCCQSCGLSETTLPTSHTGSARGNTLKYKDQQFKLWKCPTCGAIHTLGEVNFEALYSGYPLQARELDYFAKCAYKNLINRLKPLGLTKNNSILDFGCGQGIMINYLKSKDYKNVFGYDPFVKEFSNKNVFDQKFDFIIANDVIEHVENPSVFISECVKALKPGGILYVGTADAEGVKELNLLEPELMRLHLPFHRVLLTLQGLKDLGSKAGLTELDSYRRSYMDTPYPFVNYRFLNEFNASLGHVIDKAFQPIPLTHFIKHPKLFLYAFLGYILPCADEPSVIWRKPDGNKV